MIYRSALAIQKILAWQSVTHRHVGYRPPDLEYDVLLIGGLVTVVFSCFLCWKVFDAGGHDLSHVSDHCFQTSTLPSNSPSPAPVRLPSISNSFVVFPTIRLPPRVSGNPWSCRVMRLPKGCAYGFGGRHAHVANRRSRAGAAPAREPFSC